jgi:O-antigen/teichoic acid export membrane protein
VGIIKRQGLKTSIVNYAGVLIGVIFFNFVFPHLISKEHLGLIGLLQNLMYVLAMFPALGLGHVLLRYYTDWKDTEVLSRFNGLAIRLTLLASGLFAVVYWLFREPLIQFYQAQSALFVPYFYLVIPLVIIYAFTQYFEIYGMLKLRVAVPAFIREILVRILLIGLVYLFFRKWLNEQQFVFGLVGVYLLAFLILLIYVHKKLEFSWRKPFPWPEAQQNLRGPLVYGGGMLLLTVCSSIHNFLDGIILPAYLGLGALGIYLRPLVLGQMIQVPYRAISMISIPILREALAQNDLKRLSELNRSLSLNLFLIGTFLFTLLVVNNDAIFQLLPAEFAAGKSVLVIIAVGRLVDMSFGLNSEILNYSQHYKYMILFTIVMMLMTVTLNITLIPIWGMNGAAWAVSISLVVFNILKSVYLYHRYRMMSFSKAYIPLILITVVLIALFHFIPFIQFLNHHMFMNAFLNVMFRGGLAAILFLIPLYALKVSPDFNEFLQLVISGKIFRGGHKMREL